MGRLAGMALIAGCTALAASAHAQSGMELVKSKGCSKCHAVDQQIVGPSFKEIAAKNKADAKAEARLIAVLKDAKGHPKIPLSDAEAKAVVQYVLKQ